LSDCPPAAVKKFKTGRDREGEAPAEPHGAGFAGRWLARRLALPIFSQLSYQGGGNAALSALGVLLSVAMDGYHENRILKPLGRAYNAVISPSP